MKTILCYGDSNTWGYVPGKANPVTQYVERYPRDIRWTGRLQQLLGDHYYIVEEGLNGRTTNIDYPDVLGRNGKSYLLPCLYSHAPLDLVVIMLGANDLKKIFHRSAEQITEGLAELVSVIQACKYGPDMQSPPKILLIGYPILTREDGIEQYGEKILFEKGIERSKQLDALYAQLAKQHGCYYFNLAPHIHLSEIDGVHLDQEGHHVFAELIADRIKQIFKK